MFSTIAEWKKLIKCPRANVGDILQKKWKFRPHRLLCLKNEVFFTKTEKTDEEQEKILKALADKNRIRIRERADFWKALRRKAFFSGTTDRAIGTGGSCKLQKSVVRHFFDKQKRAGGFLSASYNKYPVLFFSPFPILFGGKPRLEFRNVADVPSRLPLRTRAAHARKRKLP